MSYNVTADQMNQGIDSGLKYQLSFIQDGNSLAEREELTSLRILDVNPAVAGVRSGVRSVSYGI